jgi:pyruvate,orthophosphate dikinase
MFMASDRLPVMQRMIVAEDRDARIRELDLLQVMQTEDFRGILAAMEGFPVTVRLLDPPLHEFLPKEGELRDEIAALPESDKKERAALERVLAKVLSLRESNPMLGFRGCRLGIVFPEIYEMQVRAIFTAACDLTAAGKKVLPDVMLPLIGTREEMRRLKDMVDTVAREIMESHNVDVPYHVGTMVEVPRAAMVADQLAEFAEFFSFGTNDLTQTAFGYSRDDAEGKFLADYVRLGIFDENPFHVLDREGVGRLMRIAVEDGRRARPDIKIGICGEHGGNPPSIFFCHELGLKYVSCSPFRVPVARLATAHAALASAQ